VSRRASSTLGAVSAAITTAAMIATPLASARGAVRRRLSSVVVAGLWATTSTVSARRWGAGRAVSAAATIGAATTVVERIGTTTGIPFGRYHYTPALRPQVGGVPVIVPLAWFAMAVPAREAATAILGTRRGRARRIGLGAVALTAWDLFLDPQMVHEGFWEWHRPGRYRTIPITNYLGWLVTAAGVMAALEALLPANDRADSALVGEYALMSAMETLGFAAFFKDRLVAVVGGAAMIPIAASAAQRTLRRRGR
jgi:putative membrane protein